MIINHSEFRQFLFNDIDKTYREFANPNVFLSVDEETRKNIYNAATKVAAQLHCTQLGKELLLFYTIINCGDIFEKEVVGTIMLHFIEQHNFSKKTKE